MRISAIQKDTLFILFAFEQRNRQRVRQTNLLEIISKERGNVFPNNFSVSCRTLARNNLIHLERDQSLRLYLTLSGEGRKHAEAIYNERTGEQ